MKAISLAKGAILAALTILCATQAHAQRRGGESSVGGGNPQAIPTTDQEVRVVLANIIESHQDPQVINQNAIFWIQSDEAYRDILSGEYAKRNAELGSEVDIKLRADGSVLWTPRETPPGKWPDEVSIADGDLKKVLNKVMMGVDVIDYPFIKKHEVKIRDAYADLIGEPKTERWIFDPERYKKIAVKEMSHSLDWMLLNPQIQMPPCIAEEKFKKNPNKVVKVERAMSTKPFRFAPICISISELKKIERENLDKQIRALFLHEFAHQHGFEFEDEPTKLQVYWLNEVQTGRMDVRTALNRTMSYLDRALAQKTVPQKQCNPTYDRPVDLVDFKKSCASLAYTPDWSKAQLSQPERDRLNRYNRMYGNILSQRDRITSVEEFDKMLAAAKEKLQVMLETVATRH